MRVRVLLGVQHKISVNIFGGLKFNYYICRLDTKIAVFSMSTMIIIATVVRTKGGDKPLGRLRML